MNEEQEYTAGVHNYTWFKPLGTTNKWCLVKYIAPGGYTTDIAGFRVKKKMLNNIGKPQPPTPPLSRVLNFNEYPDFCKRCGSSIKSKWLFFSTGKCIQPECSNYYKN